MSIFFRSVAVKHPVPDGTASGRSVNGIYQGEDEKISSPLLMSSTSARTKAGIRRNKSVMTSNF